MNWSYTIPTPSSANHIATLFIEAIRDHYFFQHTKEPTRFREHNISTYLDMIFTNEEGMVPNNEIKYTAGIRKSEDVIINFNFVCYSKLHKTQNNTGNRFNFIGDYEAP